MRWLGKEISPAQKCGKGNLKANFFFLDLIFLIQVPFENEKSFGEWAKAGSIYENFNLA